MSYNHGVSHCSAFEGKLHQWFFQCKPGNAEDSLEFIIYPKNLAPYEVFTSFYLVANNKPAEVAVNENADQSLLRYLMIDVKRDL